MNIQYISCVIYSPIYSPICALLLAILTHIKGPSQGSHFQPVVTIGLMLHLVDRGNVVVLVV